MAQARGGKIDADVEPAGTDGVDGPVRAQHDEGAGTSPEDAFQAVPERGSGCHPAQSCPQRFFGAPRHQVFPFTVADLRPQECRL